jgi:hypothetical protein
MYSQSSILKSNEGDKLVFFLPQSSYFTVPLFFGSQHRHASLIAQQGLMNSTGACIGMYNLRTSVYGTIVIIGPYIFSYMLIVQ